MLNMEHNRQKITWKFSNVFDSSMKRSAPISFLHNGTENRFILHSACRAAKDYDDVRVDGQNKGYHIGSLKSDTVVKSKHPVTVFILLDCMNAIPNVINFKLELVENNGTLYSLPLNWGWSTGRTIVGSILNFMDNDQLQNDYIKEGQLTLKCTISVPEPVHAAMSDMSKMFEDGLHSDAILSCQKKSRYINVFFLPVQQYLLPCLMRYWMKANLVALR